VAQEEGAPSLAKAKIPNEVSQPLNGSHPEGTAEEAAEHYRQTSPTLKKEEIRQGYKTICDRIADRFGLRVWAPVNHVTKMVATNLGDVDAFARAEMELPGSVLVAVRVLVAFQTPRERPMYMSYVFIGRRGDGDEIVALFNESREWSLLAGPENSADHERVLRETAAHQLDRLTDKIAGDIRRLK